MIGQSLIFVCATVALVTGSCFESPLSQGLSQQLVSVQPSFSSPIGCSGLGSSLSVPVISGASLSAPISSVVSSPVVSSDVLSSGSLVSSAPIAAISSPMISLGSSLSGSTLLPGLGSGLGVQITDGPQGSPITVVQAPPVTLPAVQAPTVALPSQPIPAPKILSQKCICTKTIVKPQIYQRTVTVPKIQKYIKRTVTPVVENISYKSSPVSQASTSGSGILALSSGLGSSALSSGLGSGSVAISSGMGSSLLSSGSVLTQGIVSSPVSVSSSPVAVSGISSCLC